jgi:hypothetical protein
MFMPHLDGGAVTHPLQKVLDLHFYLPQCKNANMSSSPGASAGLSKVMPHLNPLLCKSPSDKGEDF